MGAIEDSSLIRLWEEEALEVMAGWDDAYEAGTMEETLKQPQNTEHSKTCVVGIDGSKSGWKEERNYGESESSQSPQMSLTKSVSGTSAVQDGCMKDPKLASGSGSGFCFTSARRTEEDGECPVLAVNKHMGCGSDRRTFAHSANDGGKKKLEKSKNDSGRKGFHRGSSDASAHKLQIGDMSCSSAAQAIKNQSGNRCDSKVTAMDLLKTAMDVGIGLPPPFHQNYFKS